MCSDVTVIMNLCTELRRPVLKLYDTVTTTRDAVLDKPLIHKYSELTQGSTGASK